MQQMKWYRSEPPMSAARQREQGRAEPPVKRAEPHAEAPLPQLPRDALGVRAGRAEQTVTPRRVVLQQPAQAAREEFARARVTLPEAETPEELEILEWVAQQAEETLAPRPHLIQDSREVKDKPAIRARLFSNTRNIHQRRPAPFVLAADDGASAGTVTPKTRRRAAFPAGLFRRADKKPVSKDPAPSRLSYRMHRLWLTPVFRALLRTGLPAFLIVFAVGIYLSDSGRREAIAGKAEAVVRSVQERPEFMVRLMSIEGASPDLATAIRSAVPVRFPVSSFDLDLESMRQTVAGLDAVASADLRIKPGGVLELRVSERAPSVLWRGPDGLVMLDETGHPVAGINSRLERLDLPVIAGAGADKAVPEALALIEAAQPVAPRLRGLVRMGERRWDVVLDNGQRILLPEDGAVEALERVMALAIAEDMLSRDVSVVDMRFTARPTLRLAPKPAGQFMTQEEAGATNG